MAKGKRAVGLQRSPCRPRYSVVPLDKQTEAWGIKVSNVEIKRIDLDESMIRAIARQAEAERTRRAKIINAEGEQQAAQKLLDAAKILAPVPQAMQLRYLATLFDIASERSSTIVFPFPIDLTGAGFACCPLRGGYRVKTRTAFR
jgi:regulator of protease activity HflC (stomatin/prohibitin superfamily)